MSHSEAHVTFARGEKMLVQQRNERIQPIQSPSVETDPELKAYIYQQLIELQPYLVSDSQMTVAIQHVQPLTSMVEVGVAKKAVGDDLEEFDIEPATLDACEYIVKLTAMMDGASLVTEGHDENIYLAFAQAKATMLQQLNVLYNSMVDSRERDEEIQNWLSGKRTLH